MQPKTERFNFSWKLAIFFSVPLFYSGIVLLYAVWQHTFLRRRRRLILTYHRVHNGPEDPEMSVSCDHFRQHMEFLSQSFKVVSLDRLLSFHVSDRSEDLVAITFDDGFADNFEYAFPILKDKGFPATIFLISDRIAKSDPVMLSLEQIHIMKRNGISFGSHTCSHPVLANLSTEEAQKEIFKSKIVLEEMLGERVDFFAYPKGKKNQYGPEAKEFVKASGYTAAVTMENCELAHSLDRFEIGRLGVRDVSLIVFKTRLSGIFESFPFLTIRKLLGAT